MTCWLFPFIRQPSPARLLPLSSWGNHTPRPAGRAWQSLSSLGDELPGAAVRSRQGRGVFGECLVPAYFMEGNGPRGESEQTQGWESSAHSWDS